MSPFVYNSARGASHRPPFSPTGSPIGYPLRPPPFERASIGDRRPFLQERLVKGAQLFVGLLLTALVSEACASSDLVAPTQSSSCSTAGLMGNYGSQRNGQTVPGTFWTSVGLAVFDGRGNINSQQAVSINGASSPVASQVGTYTINADCTGTESDASGKVLSTLVMVHGGDEVLGISVIPGSSMTVHYERIVGPCSNAMLVGDYGFQRNGQTGPGLSLLALGTITFDGKGNSVAAQTLDRSGTVSSVANQIGTYLINPDCTGTQTDPATGKVFGQLVVVHGGDELLGMSTTAGNNVVIHYEKVK